MPQCSSPVTQRHGSVPRACSAAPQPPGQRRPGREHRRGGDAAAVPPCLIGRAKPVLRRAQAAVDQGVAARAGVAGDHARPAVGDLPRRAAIVRCHPHRVPALLGEVAAIHDEHTGCRVAEGRRDRRLLRGEYGLVIPRPAADELLHGLHIPADHGIGHRLDRLPLQGQQLPFQVLARPAPLLRAAEERRERGMVRQQLVVQRLDLLRHQFDAGRAGRGRGQPIRGAQGDPHARTSSPAAYQPHPTKSRCKTSTTAAVSW